MDMMEREYRPLKLALHTYTLHFWGFGECWGVDKDEFFPQAITLEELMDKAVEWELDGLHVTKVDIGSTDDENLAKVRKAAEDRGLFLELNCALYSYADSRIDCTVTEALEIAHKLNSPLIKFSLDVKRDRILHNSCMCPNVMEQLVQRYHLFKDAIPLIEKYNIKIAIENHTETFADEIMWLVDQLDHPLIGCCVDTCNPLQVMENPSYSLERMLPKAFCTHFSDDLIVVDELGVHDVGAAHGQGSYDCPNMVREIRLKSPMDTIVFENEIAFLYKGEPLEEAKAREMKACEDSVRYCRDVLKLGLRNR